MEYQIFYEKESLKELEKLELSVSRRIIEKIEKMSKNPSMCDIKKLKGTDYYRLRVGDYRVIFFFEKDYIKILKIAHRQNVYD